MANPGHWGTSQANPHTPQTGMLQSEAAPHPPRPLQYQGFAQVTERDGILLDLHSLTSSTATRPGWYLLRRTMAAAGKGHDRHTALAGTAAQPYLLRANCSDAIEQKLRRTHDDSSDMMTKTSTPLPREHRFVVYRNKWCTTSKQNGRVEEKCS
jgi:hypothetical protein